MEAINQAIYHYCRRLRQLRWYYRLLIIYFSFVTLEIPVVLLIMIGRDYRSVGVLLFFSGVLAALLFKWYKAAAIQFMLLFSHMLLLIYLKGIMYPSLPVFLASCLINGFIIYTIGNLYRGWRMAEEVAAARQELLGVKEQFIANLNHEMRTALATLEGYLEELQSDDLTSEERQLYLSKASRACDELKRQVYNILKAIRANSDVLPPNLTSFDLSILITDLLERMETAEHPLHQEMPGNVMVRADSQQTNQVLRNLLSNAYKYSPAGAPVDIIVRQEGQYACIYIRDRGLGIAPEQIKKLFQKFSRLQRDARGSVPGIGLGLYICRELVEGMGGKIWVKHTEGEGSTFCFTLPLER